jgi:hypothetical protein
MKKTELVIFSALAAALSWAFVLIFVYHYFPVNLASILYDLSMIAVPAVICGLLIIPIDTFFRALNGRFGHSTRFYGHIINLLLPVLDFVYIAALSLVIFPIYFEASTCFFGNEPLYCEKVFGLRHSLMAVLWLLVWFLISSWLFRLNIIRAHTDKKFLWAIVAVFVGLAAVLSYFQIEDSLGRSIF